MIDAINEMIWYSTNFLGDLSAWLLDCPVALIFVVLGILSFIVITLKKIIAC